MNIAAILNKYPRLRSVLRPLLLFLFSAFILALSSGEHRFSRSGNTHFEHLARAWSEGRLDQGDVPPGYCTKSERRAGHCKHHQFDDWARVQTIKLDSKFSTTHDLPSIVSGTLCRTDACAEATKKNPRVRQWWIVGTGWVTIPRSDYQIAGEKWYVTFPPGPALLYLPFLWLHLPIPPDIPLTWMLAACIPPILDSVLRKLRTDTSGWIAGALALAALFATPMWSIAIQGQVWFLAQIFHCLLSALVLWCLVHRRSAIWLGVWLALSMATRPSAALGLFWISGFWLLTEEAREQRFTRIIRALIAPISMSIALASLNWIRFHNPFEFGHRFLEIRWIARIQQFGLFHPRFFGRNLTTFTWLAPRWSAGPWGIQISLHGLGWLWTTTWIWAASFFACFRRFRRPRLESHQTRRAMALLSGAAIAIAPTLFYQNSGQIQWSYRFGLDGVLPWIVGLWIIFHIPRKTAIAVLLLFATLQGIGAWAWRSHPGHLFVHEPLGWPFEYELNGDK